MTRNVEHGRVTRHANTRLKRRLGRRTNPVPRSHEGRRGHNQHIEALKRRFVRVADPPGDVDRPTVQAGELVGQVKPINHRVLRRGEEPAETGGSQGEPGLLELGEVEVSPPVGLAEDTEGA